MVVNVREYNSHNKSDAERIGCFISTDAALKKCLKSGCEQGVA